jgi:hypothetical protein
MELIAPPLKVTDTGAFSRASVATYYTAAGMVGTAAAGTPRLNYPPETRIYAPSGWMAGPSLLLPSMPLPGLTIVPAKVPEFLAEPAATNVMLQSEDLTTWTASEGTVTADFSVAPDGTATSDIFRPSATDSAAHLVSKTGSAAVVEPGSKVGASIFLRAAGYGIARLRCATAGQAAGVEMVVDLQTEAIPYAGPFGAGAEFVEARIVSLAAGWFRLEIEGLVDGATTFGLFLTAGDGVSSFEGDGVAGIEVWGAQIEAGPVTSYVKSGASAGTRAADVGVPMLVSSVAEDEAVYSVATTYAKNATVRGDTSATAHNLYVSLKDSNSNKPLSNTEWWLPAGSTNRWRMFDELVGSQTIDASSITVVISPKKRVTALAFFNIDAAEMRVTQTDPVDGVVYDETISLISSNGINNLWQWAFADIERVRQKVLLDLKPYSGAQITITLSNPGNTVKCGALVIGRARSYGETLAGLRVGSTDYSRKDRDAFGNAIIVKRPFSRRNSVEVLVEKSLVDGLVELLDDFRATPIVFIGSNEYGATIIYGFYKTYEVLIAYPTHSLLSIEPESLV